VEQAVRDAIMRQGVVLPETPRSRREREWLDEDMRSLPERGQPLKARVRNFRPQADAYLAASRGPLAYMLRLREIERGVAEHEHRLAEARAELAGELAHDPDRFADEWRSLVRGWSFDEVNDLIERHNRWYPIESRLPLDPRTGDYVLVNGRDYRLAPLDADWALARFPDRGSA
jgi:hypothetical protein